MIRKLRLLAISVLSLYSDMLIGVYGGTSQNKATIYRTSTDAQAEGYRNIDKSSSLAGIYIGGIRRGYKTYISYDVSGEEKDIKVTRFMVNSDLYLGILKTDFFMPFVGLGVGYAYNDYQFGEYKTSQDNGLVAGRAGFNFELNKHNSIELMYEYSHMVTSGHHGNKIYYTNNNFDVQRDSITSQNASHLKVAYQVNF